eukprot:Em0017g751a
MSTVTPFRTIPSTSAPNGRNTVATTPTSGLGRGTSGNPSFTPKSGLLKSVGLLFCTTITRIPSEAAVKNAVNSVSTEKIGTEEFVAQFLPVVKVERLSIPNYHLYVAILRRYCRTVDASKKNTYKGFERWLEANFANGSPFAEDLQLVYNEEERLLNPPHQSEQGILIASGESYLEPCLEPASPYQYEADEQ